MPWMPLVIAFSMAIFAAPSAAQETRAWLEVTAPRDERVSTTLPLIEVSGRASARRRLRHDLVIVLDLSDSTVLSSGVDLDGDGPDGGTDPKLLRWFAGQPGAGPVLVERLQEVDLDDSILMAELSAADALIQRLDPHVFRIGIVVFSDTARAVAPLGSPRGRLEEVLREIRQGFFHELRGTNFGDAIKVAHALLAPDAPVRENGLPTREARERSILFLSDGAPTLPVHADRARLHALQAASTAAAAGIRIYSFALGREAEEALDVYSQMAILSGGQFEKISRPGDAIARLRKVDLADLKELRVTNRTTGKPVRALRVFPDGSFDGFVELASGRNYLVFEAEAKNGSQASASREVVLTPEAGADGETDDLRAERIRALLEELRRRTRETALWAELESGRRTQRPDVEIQPERPAVPTE
jgi:hypothetical protein